MSIYLAYSIFLNFLIRSQLIAKIECSVTGTGAYREKSGINIRVDISAKVGIRASPSKDISGHF